MVTKSFGYRPSLRDWYNLFSKKKKMDRTLYMVMLIESLDIDTLLGIGLIWFFSKGKKKLVS